MKFSFDWSWNVTNLSAWLDHSWPVYRLGGKRGWRFFGIRYDIDKKATQKANEEQASAPEGK